MTPKFQSQYLILSSRNINIILYKTLFYLKKLTFYNVKCWVRRAAVQRVYLNQKVEDFRCAVCSTKYWHSIWTINPDGMLHHLLITRALFMLFHGLYQTTVRGILPPPYSTFLHSKVGNKYPTCVWLIMYNWHSQSPVWRCWMTYRCLIKWSHRCSVLVWCSNDWRRSTEAVNKTVLSQTCCHRRTNACLQCVCCACVVVTSVWWWWRWWPSLA